jgi:hypothetical protein
MQFENSRPTEEGGHPGKWPRLEELRESRRPGAPCLAGFETWEPRATPLGVYSLNIDSRLLIPV